MSKGGLVPQLHTPRANGWTSPPRNTLKTQADEFSASTRLRNTSSSTTPADPVDHVSFEPGAVIVNGWRLDDVVPARSIVETLDASSVSSRWIPPTGTKWPSGGGIEMAQERSVL
jgi:hypothetical protein